MKGVKITEAQKDLALRLYSQGKTYDYIEAAAGISKASMTELVARKSGEDPDIVATHELARKLRESGKAPETLLRGAAVDEALEAGGSNLDEVSTVILPVVRKFGHETVEVCGRANEYWKVREETGYTHEQLLTEHSKKAREVEQLNRALSTGESELESLEKKIAIVGSKLDHLVDLERIKKGIERIGKTPRQASAIVEKVGEILDRGLTLDVADKISVEVERLGAKVTNVPKKIAELLERQGSLQSAVNQEERCVSTLGRAEKKLRRSVGFLKDRKTSLVQQCSDLRVDLSGLRKDYNGLGARSAAREREQNELFASRKAEQEKILAARRESFETEQKNRQDEGQTKLAAMDRYYLGVEATHKGNVSSLKEREAGFERTIAAYTVTTNRMAATIESHKALSGFLWRYEPARMNALLAISAKENDDRDRPLSDETRAFFLDSILGMMVEDTKFWPQSMGRYMTNWRGPLVVTLARVWGKKVSLEFETSKLGATLTKQEEALVNDYPTWKVLENDPNYLGRFLGRCDDEYLINVFTNLSFPDTPRFIECLRRAREVQNQNLDTWMKNWFRNEYAKFNQSLIREMGALTRQWPVYIQARPTRSLTAKAPNDVQPPPGSSGRGPKVQ